MHISQPRLSRVNALRRAPCGVRTFYGILWSSFVCRLECSAYKPKVPNPSDVTVGRVRDFSEVAIRLGVSDRDHKT